MMAQAARPFRQRHRSKQTQPTYHRRRQTTTVTKVLSKRLREMGSPAASRGQATSLPAPPLLKPNIIIFVFEVGFKNRVLTYPSPSQKGRSQHAKRAIGRGS